MKDAAMAAHYVHLPKEKRRKWEWNSIFALSQSAVHYFRDRMHYAEFSRDSLPPETSAHPGT